MATTYAQEVQPQVATPPGMSSGAVQGGSVRRWRATITLASQPSADIIVLANIPAGHMFDFGTLNASVSLGTATVAIGVAGTAGKYRTAAVFTATNTPIVFGNVAGETGDPLGGTGEHQAWCKLFDRQQAVLEQLADTKKGNA